MNANIAVSICCSPKKISHHYESNEIKMSTNQQYSLRWNNHQPNFISMFTSLLSTKTLVDVTLAAEGKQMCAHKVVLSACSTYFQSLFVENPSTHPIVILKDVSFADLRIMVDFMYYGEVNVTEAQLPKVLETARMLKIKGLTEMPENTSLTRFQGSSSAPEYHTPDSESHMICSSPPSSPQSPALPGITAHKRKRRRKLSMESSGLNRTHDISQELKNDEAGPSLDMVQSETVTLSSLPQQKNTRDTEDRQLCVNTPQTQPGHNLNMEPMHLDQHPGMSQGGQWSMMEHTYPRYTNACVGGGMQGDTGMYVNNVLNQHVDELNYGQGLGVGPSCVAEQPTQPNETPVQTKRRRTTNPQSEENFQRALEAVRFGGIGFCKAARIFGVNNRTLWLEYKKKGYPNNRPSIKSRIKREHTTPPPEQKEEVQQPEQQMAVICSPPVQVGFIDSRPLDFPLQGVAHNSSINILGMNFNSIQ